MQWISRKSNSLQILNDKYVEYACNKASELVKKKLEEFIRMYYHEYTPEFYDRTWKFLNSVVKTKAVKHGNSYVAQVYIDTSIEYSSYWNRKHWNMGNTAYMAEQGMHGRYYNSGSHFFSDAFDAILDDEHLTASLAEFFKKNGIRVSYERF